MVGWVCEKNRRSPRAPGWLAGGLALPSVIPASRLSRPLTRSHLTFEWTGEHGGNTHQRTVTRAHTHTHTHQLGISVTRIAAQSGVDWPFWHPVEGEKRFAFLSPHRLVVPWSSSRSGHLSRSFPLDGEPRLSTRLFTCVVGPRAAYVGI